jgi:hypothetical protein
LVDRIIDYIEDADIIFGHNKNKGKTNWGNLKQRNGMKYSAKSKSSQAIFSVYQAEHSRLIRRALAITRIWTRLLEKK